MTIEELQNQIEELKRKISELEEQQELFIVKSRLISLPTSFLKLKRLDVLADNKSHSIRIDPNGLSLLGTSNLIQFWPSGIFEDGDSWIISGQSEGITFESDLIIAGNVIPNANNLYDLGTTAKKWRDIKVNKYNGSTPLAGTKTYYVADNSGGAVTRKLTFTDGILTSET